MDVSPSELLAKIEALTERVLKLETEKAELEKENAELRERLGMSPRNSSLPPSSEHPHAKPASETQGKKKKKRGGQKGHPKHERMLIPTEECQAVHQYKPDVCADCGKKLSGTDSATSAAPGDRPP